MDDACKSVDILQAIRWSAMAWNELPQSTVVKCFIKAGILNSEGTCNAKAVEAADDDVDPFAELDGDLTTVEQLAKETNGTDMSSIKVTTEGCYDPSFQSIGKRAFTLARFRNLNKIIMTLMIKRSTK